MLKIQQELRELLQVVGHDMISKEDKINILNNMISNLNVHIKALESYEWLDVEGKKPKQSILFDMYNQKNALQQELANINVS